MSASEKLKALESRDGLGNKMQTYLQQQTFYAALPQIVAVVEAAEVLPEFFDTPDGRKHSFIPLLDALDEALS